MGLYLCDVPSWYSSSVLELFQLSPLFLQTPGLACSLNKTFEIENLMIALLYAYLVQHLCSENWCPGELEMQHSHQAAQK
jgi:hypothetical protein